MSATSLAVAMAPSTTSGDIRLEPKQIRRIRLLQHKSQTDFAKVMGVGLRTLQRWEYGVTYPLPVFEAMLLKMKR